MNLSLAESNNTYYRATGYPSLTDEKLLDVLRLIRSENVGPVTFFQLVSLYGSAKHALEEIPYLSLKGGRKKPIAICKQEQVEKEIEAAEKYGARILKYGEVDYPAALCVLYDPPPVISVLGNISLYNQRPVVGMVGARNASANACQFAHKVAMELGTQGITIVSGLARGIDTAVHKGSLASGTIAVIAGGIDNIYPPENDKLYASIREQGAIMSEQPFGSEPFASSFPGRNRIISGLSKALVVVEASHKSGSLITARYALEQGREVFAVPGSPMDPRCKGTNSLLRDGASFCESAEDVLSYLNHLKAKLMAEIEPPVYLPAPTVYDEKQQEEARRLIGLKLGFEPVLVDELLIQCQLPPSLLHTVLLEYELAGRLHRHPGGKVSLVYKNE